MAEAKPRPQPKKRGPGRPRKATVEEPGRPVIPVEPVPAAPVSVEASNPVDEVDEPEADNGVGMNIDLPQVPDNAGEEMDVGEDGVEHDDYEGWDGFGSGGANGDEMDQDDPLPRLEKSHGERDSSPHAEVPLVSNNI